MWLGKLSAKAEGACDPEKAQGLDLNPAGFPEEEAGPMGSRRRSGRPRPPAPPAPAPPPRPGWRGRGNAARWAPGPGSGRRRRRARECQGPATRSRGPDGRARCSRP
ncbi:hypothetical protein R6Z07M_008034 [Ovis aries]